LLVKCAHSREVVIDDFATSKVPLCNETLRSLTGGNSVSAAGKNEKELTFSTDFLIRLIFNKWPAFDSPLTEPDIRRLGLLYFPCCYRAASRYDASNPNHRLQIDFKDRMASFAAEFVEWTRLLAPFTRAGGAKFMLPAPESSMEIMSALLPPAVHSAQDGVKDFISICLRPLGTSERPSSRDAINKRCVKFLYPDADAKTMEGNIKILLRGKLLAPEKCWSARIGGQQQPKTPIYKFTDSNACDAICTLKSEQEIDEAITAKAADQQP
jgi:hypothetical protein